jgi:hypothetical protein
VQSWERRLATYPNQSVCAAHAHNRTTSAVLFADGDGAPIRAVCGPTAVLAVHLQHFASWHQGAVMVLPASNRSANHCWCGSLVLAVADDPCQYGVSKQCCFSGDETAFPTLSAARVYANA